MDTSIICGYYKLPKRIERAKKRLARFELNFWQQSFINCPLSFDDNGNKLCYEPFGKQIDRLIDDESLNHDVVNLLAFKWEYFNRYLDGLSQDEREYLHDRYESKLNIPQSEKVDQKTINECNQIEEASGYRYGFVNDEAVDITQEYESNFRQMLKMFS